MGGRALPQHVPHDNCITREWECYRADLVDPATNHAMLVEIRRAFFAGAMAAVILRARGATHLELVAELTTFSASVGEGPEDN